MRRWRAAGPSRPGNGQVQDNGGRGRRGRVTSRVAALCATVLGAAAMVVGAGGTAAAAPPGCVSLDVIAIPGTWETSDHGAPAGSPGMLGAVTYNLPSSMRADYVPYAATAFPWEGKVYGASKHEAITNASNLIGDIAAQCPDTRFALIGYSQGADAAGDLAAAIGHGDGVIPADKVAAVGLVSDPRRSVFDTLVGPPVVGNGSGGARIGGFGALGDQVRTFCSPGDLYCAAPPGDFMTRMAGYLVQQSDPGSSEPDRYQPEGVALYDAIMEAGGIPTLGQQISDVTLWAHVDKYKQFLNSGIHQDYTTFPVTGDGTSATEWLRSWLISKA